MKSHGFSLIQHVFFFGLLIGATILLFWLFNPLLPAIFWAIILAVIFEPVKRWWHMELKTHINIAAFLTVLTVVALVLLPLFGVGTMVFNEARSFYSSLSVGDFRGTGPANVVGALETVADYLERYGDLLVLRARPAGGSPNRRWHSGRGLLCSCCICY